MIEPIFYLTEGSRQREYKGRSKHNGDNPRQVSGEK